MAQGVGNQYDLAGRFLMDLFLRRHLLLDIAPCADLEPSANPAELFGRAARSLAAAHNALNWRLRPVRRERKFRALEDFR